MSVVAEDRLSENYRTTPHPLELCDISSHRSPCRARYPLKDRNRRQIMPFLRSRYGSRIDIPLGMPAEEAFAEACQHLDVRASYKARYLYYRVDSIRAIYTDHPVFCGEDQELFLHNSPSRVAVTCKVLSPLLYTMILATFVLHYVQQEGTIPLYLSSTAGTLGTLCAMSLMFIPWHEVAILLRRDKIYGRYELRSYINRDSLSMKLPEKSLA